MDKYEIVKNKIVENEYLKFIITGLFNPSYENLNEVNVFAPLSLVLKKYQHIKYSNTVLYTIHETFSY